MFLEFVFGNHLKNFDKTILRVFFLQMRRESALELDPEVFHDLLVLRFFCGKVFSTV